MYRVAMVGAGGMASMHARCYSQMPNASVVGVMDLRGEAAGTLARDVGATPYTDASQMLDELQPDVVDVCVPTPFHCEYVCEAARRRPKGIVVEKPMGRTVAQCEQMMSECAAAGVPLFPAHVLRFFPEFVAAHDQVAGGAVGNVVTVRTRRGGPFPRAWENWYGKPALSGGVILDLIIHDFDWLRWTFGEVSRVFAKGLSAGGDAAEVTKDYALVTLRFASGAIGHVEGTWADPGGFKVAFEVAGDAGLLELNFNQPSSPPYVAAVEAADQAGPGVAVPESPTAVNPYYLELAHFLECLDAGKKPAITAQDGLEAVRIALAAFESAATGSVIKVA